MKHFQMTVDLERYLQKPDDDLRGILVDDNGEPMPPLQVRRRLAVAFGRGFEVLPVCDNPGPSGFCNCDPRALPCKCGRVDFPGGARHCDACGAVIARSPP